MWLTPAHVRPPPPCNGGNGTHSPRPSPCELPPRTRARVVVDDETREVVGKLRGGGDERQSASTQGRDSMTTTMIMSSHAQQRQQHQHFDFQMAQTKIQDNNTPSSSQLHPLTITSQGTTSQSTSSSTPTLSSLTSLLLPQMPRPSTTSSCRLVVSPIPPPPTMITKSSLPPSSSTFLSRLSPSQLQIVCEPHMTGHTILIRATAGAGKTAVLTARMLRLVIDGNVDPASCLIITFTKRASNELHARAQSICEGFHHRFRVMTFHSFCIQTLNEYGEGSRILGFLQDHDVNVLSDKDQLALVEHCILRWAVDELSRPSKEELVAVLVQGDQIFDEDDVDDDGDEFRHHQQENNNNPQTSLYDGQKLRPALVPNGPQRPKINPKVVLRTRSLITEVTTNLLHEDVIASLYSPDFAKIYTFYLTSLAVLRSTSLEQVCPALVRLLKQDKQLAITIANRSPYIFVDEFQDCSPSELALLTVLVQSRQVPGQLVVCGDENQSIYSFRNRGNSCKGENVFVRLGQGVGPCIEMCLETNYRSVPAIVEAARRLISNNDRGERITASSSSMSSDVVTIWPCETRQQEAEKVVAAISTLLRDGNSSIAILARTSRMLRPVMLECKRVGVPLLGQSPTSSNSGISHHHSRIQSMLALLKLAGEFGLSSWEQELAVFRRACTTPKRRGVSSSIVTRIAQLNRRGSESLLDTTKRLCGGEDSVSEFKPITIHSLRELLQLIEMLRAMMRRGGTTTTVCDLLTECSRALNSVDRLYGDDEQTFDFHFELLMIDADVVEHDALSGINVLHAFLRRCDAVVGNNPGDKLHNHTTSHHRGIFCGTIHQSKGLEFDQVFIVGFNEGSLPIEGTKKRAAIVGAGFLECAVDMEIDNTNLTKEHLKEERRIAFVAMTRARSKVTMTFVLRDVDRVATCSRFWSEIVG